MEVLMEQKMIDIKSEPLEMVVDHVQKPTSGRRRSSSSPQSQPALAELEPCEEFPILYGLLTAPKSFKPRNSEELQLLPPLELFSDSDNSKSDTVEKESVGLRVTSRVQLVQCRRRRGSSSQDSTDELDESEDLEEEAYSQNYDFNSSSSRSSSNSPHMVDSSSNLSAPEARDYLIGGSSSNSQNGEGDISEDESTCSLIGSPEDNSCSGGDDSIDDNIPTSTTSGFKRKATRLETAIGNIVRRRVRVQKRSSCNNSNSNNINSSSNVPISMAPSSPTVSTTCVDPPTPPPQRGRSEILERILRSTNNSPSQQHSPPLRRNHNDDNNNEGSYDGPYAKLRDLLTMSEDQLVKRRRLEYGLNENSNAKVYHAGQNNDDNSSHPQRRREFSPPRNNILASLLQKGRAPYEPTSSSSPFNHHSQMRSMPSLLQINGSSSSKLLGGNSRHNVIVNMNDERPYKCSLCDLRFKKLPLLNRHVKTHSHIKRYVCRFCSHAFKRSDNLLAHMRTSCKGVKEADTKFAGVVRPVPLPQNRNNSNSGSQNRHGGQIINQLLSTPPSAGSPMVSRSQLEEALLNNLRTHHEDQPRSQQERRYSSPLSPLVSTTTASPPPPPSSQRSPADLQSRHSKLLEILSGTPVNRFPVPVVPVDDSEEPEEEEQEMPLPLSLKVERRASSPPPTCSSSSSSSQYHRSHHHNQLRSALFPNELPLEENDGEEQLDGDDAYIDEDEVENDSEQPLNLGRAAVRAPPTPPVVPSAKSRDHPEIVSILSRQPKSNVVMLAAADLRKLVGIDTL